MHNLIKNKSLIDAIIEVWGFLLSSVDSAQLVS